MGATSEQEARTCGLLDLRDRLNEKAATLDQMAVNTSLASEANRLIGKAEGVRLALSFVEELIRDF